MAAHVQGNTSWRSYIMTTMTFPSAKIRRYKLLLAILGAFAVGLLCFILQPSIGSSQGHTFYHAHAHTGMNQFKPTETTCMKTFHNLCIESNSSAPRGKQVVVYGSQRQYKQKYGVFEINFKTDEVPVSHLKIQDYPAYLEAIYGTGGNPHHLLNQCILPLFMMLQQTNMLNSPVNSSKLYFQNYRAGKLHFVDHQLVWEELLPALSVRQDYSPWTKETRNICYSNAAIFTDLSFMDVGHMKTNAPVRRKMATHILHYFGISHPKRSPSESFKVLFIQRRTSRHILNLKELIEETNSLGAQVRTVYMEDLTLRDQIDAIHESDIIIGVQGAALTLCTFARPGSHLVEIAWPKFGWLFFYTNTVLRTYDIKLHQIQVEPKDIFPNMYQFMTDKHVADSPLHYRNNTKDLLNGKRKITDIHNGNPFKFSDVFISPGVLRRLLKDIMDTKPLRSSRDIKPNKSVYKSSKLAITANSHKNRSPRSADSFVGTQ